MVKAPLLSTTLDERTVAVARAGLDPDDAVHDVAQLERWERRFADWLGVDGGPTAVHAFGSGRAALFAVVRALGMGAGDAVVVPAFTCRSVTHAIRSAGAAVVFADIETDTFGLDVQAVLEVITPQVRAVLLQHSFGLPGRDVDALLALARARGLLVIEDCAHALGAVWRGRPVGTLADAAIFSFERGKVLTTIHGGMAVVNPPAAAARLRRQAEQAPQPEPRALRALLGSVGLDHRQCCGGAGDAALAAAMAGTAPTPRMWPEEFEGRPCALYGQRMAPVVAALAQVQFDRLDEVLTRRRAQAAAWQAWADAAGHKRARVPDGAEPAWLRFPLWVDAATKAAPQALEEQLGVEVGLWFTTPEHPVPSPRAHCPHGMDACARVINLPTLLPPGHPHAVR